MRLVTDREQRYRGGRAQAFDSRRVFSVMSMIGVPVSSPTAITAAG